MADKRRQLAGRGYVGREPAGVAVAVEIGDGWPDLAVANRGDASISVLLNRGAQGGRYRLALPLIRR